MRARYLRENKKAEYSIMLINNELISHLLDIDDICRERIDMLVKSYEEIANRIKTRIDPSIIPTIDIVNIQGKDLIVVKVIPGQHTPYYYVNKGTRIAYIRKGDQDCETNSTELNELILRGRNQGWDELVTDNLYKDFTFEKLKKYFKDIKDYKIGKEELESFGLLSGEKLTNAALLYSDQNPVVGSFISCTRWNGLDKLSRVYNKVWRFKKIFMLDKPKTRRFWYTSLKKINKKRASRFCCFK